MVSWGKPTFERLVAADPEPLTSSFKVTHAMVLNVIDRPGDAFAAMRHLLTDNHEDRAAQRRHIHQAIAIYRALLAGGVVERLDEPDAEGRMVRLTVDLQFDFALNQPLSPFALAAIELLDRESPSYPLDVLSVIESTLDNPRQVLSAQQFKARGEAVAQMKADGIDVREADGPAGLGHVPKAAGGPARGRLQHLPPRPPLGGRLRGVAEVRRPRHVRAGADLHRVRGFYGLSRSEGLVLRYLADAYKALRQTVPDEAKTEELTDLIEWLGELVRQVDSSLIDEWERLRNPLASAQPRGRAADHGHLATSARSGCWCATPCSSGSAGRAWPLRRTRRPGRVLRMGFRRVGDALEPYFEVHDEIGTGPDARGPALLIIDEQPGHWVVRQIFDDPAGDHDWGISAVIDLAASDEAGSAVLRITDVGQL